MIYVAAYLYVSMPVNKDGNGPCDKEDAVRFLHEVWSSCEETVCECPNEETAKWLAARLNGYAKPLPTVAPQQKVADDTARDAFMNALRILHSMEPVWLPVKFTRDPVNYLLRADDATVDRIWAAIQERQPARYRA